jgi:hypothetical protein
MTDEKNPGLVNEGEGIGKASSKAELCPLCKKGSPLSFVEHDHRIDISCDSRTAEERGCDPTNHSSRDVGVIEPCTEVS